MKLQVKYRGPEPDSGRMSVQDIGPAMIGIGEMVGEASRVLYGPDKRVRVEVRADFEHASFGIEFFAVAPVADLLSGLTLEQLANICTVLGFGGATAVGGVKGLIALLRWQAGRKVERVENVGGDQIRITVEGGSVQNLTVNEYKVFIDPTIRKGLKAIVAPLEKERVESVEIKREDEPAELIERNERQKFLAAPVPEEEISVDTYTAPLEVVTPSFREDYKWRFAQGGNVFFAEIKDEAFLANVARANERFAAGDVLRCRVELRTTRSAEGPKFQHVIMEVLEHIKAPSGTQLSLLAPSETKKNGPPP